MKLLSTKLVAFDLFQISNVIYGPDFMIDVNSSYHQSTCSKSEYYVSVTKCFYLPHCLPGDSTKLIWTEFTWLLTLVFLQKQTNRTWCLEMYSLKYYNLCICVESHKTYGDFPWCTFHILFNYNSVKTGTGRKWVD